MSNVLMQVFKGVIIVSFLIYTLQCFTVLLASEEKKIKIYKQQVGTIFFIQLMTFSVLYTNTKEIGVLIIYVFQIILLVFISEAYRFVYKDLSRELLNNVLMFIMIGLVVLTRIDIKYAIKQMVYIGIISLVCLFVPLIIEKFKYFNKLGIIYAAIGIGLLGLVFVIGKEHYGAKNWIQIGGFEMQPSEFVKIIYVFFLSALLEKDVTFKRVFKVSILAAIHVLILVAQKDLGSALLFFITYLFIVFVASGNFGYLFGGLSMGAVAAMVSYKLFSHVRIRVLAWKDPWSHIESEGYQVCQSLFAIGTGGWFGLGFTGGAPNYIPVVESDFIFSCISEEFGAFFAICLIIIEISCFVMFINVALKIRRRFFKLTALGLAVEYIFQVFLTVGGAIKFIPSTGVTLPLISYGGSSVISTFVLFSIIQGMYVLDKADRKKIEEELVKREVEVGDEEW